MPLTVFSRPSEAKDCFKNVVWEVCSFADLKTKKNTYAADLLLYLPNELSFQNIVLINHLIEKLIYHIPFFGFVNYWFSLKVWRKEGEKNLKKNNDKANLQSLENCMFGKNYGNV